MSENSYHVLTLVFLIETSSESLKNRPVSDLIQLLENAQACFRHDTFQIRSACAETINEQQWKLLRAG